MVLTTDTFWSVNDTPLQTLAYNITTWGGDLQAPPPLRGDDITIPYRPGEVFFKRRPAGRSITFDMWVVGADVDGKVPTANSARAEFEKNFKALRNLLWNGGNRVTLTRRWKDPGSSVVRTASAQAIFAGGLSPAMNGANRATFSAELYLADPFFYGDEVTVNFPANATSTVSPVILGDYETTAINLTLRGVRNNVRLTNTSEATWVNVNRNISVTTASVTLDVDNWEAQFVPASGPATNTIADVTQFGHEFWMVLRPGTQNLVLSSTSGSGTATLRYRPRWI